MKRLISVPLKEVRTNDEEGLGSLYESKGKVYRWVKNRGSTNLVANAVCLCVITGSEANALTRVVAPTGKAANTALVSLPAGVPVTGICKSGSATGSYGWVQVKGVATVKHHRYANTAIAAGVHSIATGTADNRWVNASGVQIPSLKLLKGIAAGAAGAVTAVGYVHCM